MAPKHRAKDVTIPPPAASPVVTRPPSLADIRTRALHDKSEVAHTTADSEAWRARTIAELEAWQAEIACTLAFLRAAKEV